MTLGRVRLNLYIENNKGSKGFSQKKIALMSGCNQAYLSNLKTGKRPMPTLQIATGLEIATNRFVKITDWSKDA